LPTWWAWEGVSKVDCARLEQEVPVKTEFVRTSLLTTVASTADEVHPGPEVSGWLDDLREHLDLPGEYIAFLDGDENATAFVLRREWTRIGRSLAADIRFDDPTVSRRHALIVRQPDGLRVLDDRSLNGVFVNGKRVEWSPLRDGDEIAVGRHRLHFILIHAVSGMRDLDAAGGPETGAHAAGSL
jgi:hypothetical protein